MAPRDTSGQANPKKPTKRKVERVGAATRNLLAFRAVESKIHHLSGTVASVSPTTRCTRKLSR
jgi:hypothetical protein